jgi:transglutaminase-like putative cysteine protease
MLYTVSHRTTYRYSTPVSFSLHRLHLSPRPCPNQTCQRTALSVSPTPTVQSQAIDYFGNPVTNITVQDEHHVLELHARSIIDVAPPPIPLAEATAPWDALSGELTADTSKSGLDALQYIFDSPLSAAAPALADYAGASFQPRRPVLDAAKELTTRIYNDFTYDSMATTVSTPVDTVFTNRRGVCQDFAHLQIAMLRSVGVPARYVSGYLLTYPPEGAEKLVGSDASHAWLAVWCGTHGWIDLDPTNDMFVGDEHVTLAWGRDYADVSPVNGAIFGGGAHSIEVAVDVTPSPSNPG